MKDNSTVTNYREITDNEINNDNEINDESLPTRTETNSLHRKLAIIGGAAANTLPYIPAGLKWEGPLKIPLTIGGAISNFFVAAVAIDEIFDIPSETNSSIKWSAIIFSILSSAPLGFTALLEYTSDSIITDSIKNRAGINVIAYTAFTLTLISHSYIHYNPSKKAVAYRQEYLKQLVMPFIVWFDKDFEKFHTMQVILAHYLNQYIIDGIKSDDIPTLNGYLEELRECIYSERIQKENLALLFQKILPPQVNPSDYKVSKYRVIPSFIGGVLIIISGSSFLSSTAASLSEHMPLWAAHTISTVSALPLAMLFYDWVYGLYFNREDFSRKITTSLRQFKENNSVGRVVYYTSMFFAFVFPLFSWATALDLFQENIVPVISHLFTEEGANILAYLITIPLASLFNEIATLRGINDHVVPRISPMDAIEEKRGEVLKANERLIDLLKNLKRQELMDLLKDGVPIDLQDFGKEPVESHRSRRTWYTASLGIFARRSTSIKEDEPLLLAEEKQPDNLESVGQNSMSYFRCGIL